MRSFRSNLGGCCAYMVEMAKEGGHMVGKGAAGAIWVKSSQCHGCLTCQLSCSLRVSGRFNPAKANILVNRSEDGYEYRHRFTDGCDGCGGDYLCVHSCPYGALILERT